MALLRKDLQVCASRCRVWKSRSRSTASRASPRHSNVPIAPNCHVRTINRPRSFAHRLECSGCAVASNRVRMVTADVTTCYEGGSCAKDVSTSTHGPRESLSNNCCRVLRAASPASVLVATRAHLLSRSFAMYCPDTQSEYAFCNNLLLWVTLLGACAQPGVHVAGLSAVLLLRPRMAGPRLTIPRTRLPSRPRNSCDCAETRKNLADACSGRVHFMQSPAQQNDMTVSLRYLSWSRACCCPAEAACSAGVPEQVRQSTQSCCP